MSKVRCGEQGDDPVEGGGHAGTEAGETEVE